MGISPLNSAATLTGNETGVANNDSLTEENPSSKISKEDRRNHMASMAEEVNKTPAQADANKTKGIDPFALKEGDHLANMVKRGRKFFHGAGNSIMAVTGGIGALLFLGLGWRTLGIGIGGVGVLLGYLLKNKIANAGLGKEPQKELVQLINKSDFPKEYKLAMLEMVKDAYKSQNLNAINPENIKAHVDKTLQKVRDMMSSLAQAPGPQNNQDPEAATA